MEEERKWCVYCHTNKINGKKYIGITRQDIRIRWRNGTGYRKNGQPKFRNAINKYGWDNFTHEILEKNIDTIENANTREIYYIQFFNSFKSGYNGTIGGGGTIGTNEKKVIQLDNSGNVIKEYISVRSASTKNNISYSNISGCVLHKHKSAGGYHWIYSKEYKNMSCEEQHNWFVEVESNNSNNEIAKDNQKKSCMKEVVQFDAFGNYIKLWKSHSEISKYYNINYSISKNKKYDNYIWIIKEKYEKMNKIEFAEHIKYCNSNNRYSEETNHKRALSNTGKKLTEETKEKIREKHIGKKLSEEHRNKIGWSQRTPIIQLDMDGNFIREWDGSKYAQKIGGFDGSSIIKCCKKKNKYHKNYKWMYASEYYNPETDKDLPIYENKEQ